MAKPRTLIIAEAGVNHNGDLELAKRLIQVAAQKGADLVKVQTFKAEKVVTLAAAKADYQKKNDGVSDSQLAMLKKLELSPEAHHILIAEAKKMGIGFLSTAFDSESVELLDQLGMPFFKVPSGEITNLPYLRQIAAIKKPVILSTGMADLPEVEAALQVFYDAKLDPTDLIVLHCTTEYPAPKGEVNLLAMLSLGQALGVQIGYSDHTQGIEVSLAAVALGAQVIEKHFTLDKNLPGPDHLASMEPDELGALVKGVRQLDKVFETGKDLPGPQSAALAQLLKGWPDLEKSLGDGKKECSKTEEKNRAIARRSIVAAQPIKAGEVFGTQNLTAKRPGTGISPMLWDQVLGQTAKRDFSTDELIEV